jgi:hypothetical protein
MAAGPPRSIRQILAALESVLELRAQFFSDFKGVRHKL